MRDHRRRTPKGTLVLGRKEPRHGHERKQFVSVVPTLAQQLPLEVWVSFAQIVDESRHGQSRFKLGPAAAQTMTPPELPEAIPYSPRVVRQKLRRIGLSQQGKS